MKKFDSSYDRSQALTLANQLADKRQGVQLPDPGIQTPVVAESTAEEVSEVRTYPEPPKASFRDKEIYRDQVWGMLLHWAQEVTNSSGAFVCDASGLVIAEQGVVPETHEAVPSILVSALSNLKRCSQRNEPPKQISAKLDDAWITVLTFADAEINDLACGLLSSECPKPDAMNHVDALFSEKIAEF